jgi:hypothetical protein
VVLVNGNDLTDVSGVKLARFVGTSSTIQVMGVSNNQCAQETYCAFAAALCINTSLRRLWLVNNVFRDKSLVDAAFVHALRLNPYRPAESEWYLYSYNNEYKRLKRAAEALGHPTLQELLCGLHLTNNREVRRNLH